MKKGLLASVLVAVTVFAAVSLISGATYLLWPVGPFPLGNLLTAAGLVSPPLAAWLYAGNRRWLRGFCLVAMTLAALWYPVSIVMAGNPSLNFTGYRGVPWVWLTLGSAVLSLLSPVLVAGARLIDRLRRS